MSVILLIDFSFTLGIKGSHKETYVTNLAKRVTISIM